MKTEPNNPQRRFGFIPRALELVPEGIKFFALVALTCWIPTIAFCLVINQSAVSYGMACHQALGGLLGVLIYKKSSNHFLSCIPIHQVPVVPNEDIREMKKAA
jgi:hypothetical protein